MTQPSVRATYLGTATLLLEVGSLKFLSDPVFDRKDSHYQLGPVELTKTSDPVIPIAALPPIDAVLLSHDQHADNLDIAARAWLPSAIRVLTTPTGAGRLGGNAHGLASLESLTVESNEGFKVTVTALPAQHGPDGTQEMTGPVTGFLIDWPGCSGAIYISGDTVPFAGTRQIVDKYRGRIAIAILHIGCVKLPMAGDLRFTMTAQEAVELAQSLEARLVVPIHYEGWAHFTEGRAAAEPVFEVSGLRVEWLLPGTPTALPV